MIEIPGDIDVTQKGKDSLEKETQEKREQTALTAMYMSTAQIPESPAEPATQILESQVDVEVRTMLTGPESEALFGEGGPALQPDPMVTASVAELVGQLSASSSEMSGNPSLGGQPPFNIDPAMLSSVTASLGADQRSVWELCHA